MRVQGKITPTPCRKWTVANCRSGAGHRLNFLGAIMMLAPTFKIAQNPIMEHEVPARKRWNEEETILALYLYFQLPFGQLHSGNTEIQKLASALNRSNNSVAMKLSNFASLDPKIVASGRKGLAGTSKLDRVIYNEFGQDWSGLVARAEGIWTIKIENSSPVLSALKDNYSQFIFEPYQGVSTAQGLITQRVGQNFFRRAVLANFDQTCCITGISDSRLLVASHIKPWSVDAVNRHNPANGLLLSATLDRAFDCGLITIDQNQRVLVSRQLRVSQSRPTREYFEQYEQIKLRPGHRFDPDTTFIKWHNNNCFVDRLTT